jgi:hemerythrin-like domain-containing protein
MHLKPTRGATAGPSAMRRDTRTPENDALAYLERQHREVADLFRQFEVAGTEDRRAAILRTIADGLAIHTAIEETHLYSATRSKLADDVSDETMNDHRDIKSILADIVDVSVSDPNFDAKLKALRDAVERHVQNEERRLFPKVRRMLSTTELGDIARKMRTQQDSMEGTEPRLQVYAEPAPTATLH